jgi:hypothetical protein
VWAQRSVRSHLHLLGDCTLFHMAEPLSANIIFEQSKRHVIVFVEIAFIFILFWRLHRLMAEELVA